MKYLLLILLIPIITKADIATDKATEAFIKQYNIDKNVEAYVEKYLPAIVKKYGPDVVSIGKVVSEGKVELKWEFR